jgi:hypothetical protein
MALSPELQKEIQTLVQRANHGDQNAMAMIEQVRKNAQGGVALAQESHKAIMNCVMGYEKKTNLDIGDDATQALGALKNPAIPPDELLNILCFLPHALDGILLHAACVILSRGPMWPDDKIAVVQSMIPPTVQGEFQSGFHGAGLASGAEVSFGYAGHVLSHARRIQAVRNSGLPPSQINANMGWELDC